MDAFLLEEAAVKREKEVMVIGKRVRQQAGVTGIGSG